MKREIATISFLIAATFILSNSSADTFPIERIITENYRIIDADDLDTSLKTVEVLQKMIFAVDIANPYDQAQRVATLVLVQNSNGDSVFDTWSEIVLEPTEISTQTFNWFAPIEDGLYTVTFFFWESVDNPTAIAPVTTMEFEVLPVDDTSGNDSCLPENIFQINYILEKGNIETICYDETTISLLVKINVPEKNEFNIQIPKHLVYSLVDVNCEEDDSIIVLMDGQEIFPEKLSSENKFYNITINVPAGSHSIEFIGTTIIPDPSPVQYCGLVMGYESQFLPPKLQIERGMKAEQIRCNEGLELVLKSNNGNPVCASSQTKNKLIERGWAKPT